jgi:hypothetical protein
LGIGGPKFSMTHFVLKLIPQWPSGRLGDLRGNPAGLTGAPGVTKNNLKDTQMGGRETSGNICGHARFAIHEFFNKSYIGKLKYRFSCFSVLSRLSATGGPKTVTNGTGLENAPSVDRNFPGRPILRSSWDGYESNNLITFPTLKFGLK